MVKTKMKDMIKIQIDDHLASAIKRTFKSGRVGYGYYGKVVIGGERYQVSLNVVKIESKGEK